MGVIKKVPDHAHPGHTKDVTMPVFSYFPNDGLAQVIVDAWADAGIRGRLLQRDAAGNPTPVAVQEATQRINLQGGFNLQRAVVISEEEHDNDYTMQQDNEVVFVLPKDNRVVAGTVGLTLLNTARLLMACTPNGI
jgi:ABC-type cobalamin transport system ATPase subunit